MLRVGYGQVSQNLPYFDLSVAYVEMRGLYRNPSQGSVTEATEVAWTGLQYQDTIVPTGTDIKLKRAIDYSPELIGPYFHDGYKMKMV